MADTQKDPQSSIVKIRVVNPPTADPTEINLKELKDDEISKLVQNDIRQSIEFLERKWGSFVVARKILADLQNHIATRFNAEQSAE